VNLCLHHCEAEALKAELARLLADAHPSSCIHLTIDDDRERYRKLGGICAIAINGLAGAILTLHADAKTLVRDIEDAIRRHDI